MDEVRDKKILIDTNILVYCGDKDYGQQAQKLLRTFKDNGNRLAISDLTAFELIKNGIDLKLREYYLRIANYIDNIPVDKTRLMNGYYLYHLYHKEFGGKCSMDSIDVIIGGTVLKEKGALLLTANRRDFPMPFWKLISQTHFIKKEKDGEGDMLVNIFLLEFNYSLIPQENIIRSL